MRLADIYANVPVLQCKGLCQDYCGPVPATDAEVVAMRQETLVQFHHDETMGIIEPDTDWNCPLLRSDGKCDAYKNRPLICRIWGTVRALQCPHGCLPERWLSDVEVRRLFAEIKTVKT